jgi:glycerol-1-phosphate dehydrogenase [NAD(P)+]
MRDNIIPWRQLCPVEDQSVSMEMGPIYIGEGLIAQCGEACLKAGLRGSALVGMDQNTALAAGNAVVASLQSAGIDAQPHMVGPQDGSRFVSTTDYSHEIVKSLEQPPDFFVSVGAGSVTDIIKYAAYMMKRPFVSVVSAASVDAYTSSIAAMVDGGVKKSLPVNPPALVITDMDVVNASPLELTTSGYGDTLAKCTSCADWVMARELTGESYSEEVSKATFSYAKQLIPLADKIKRHDKDAMDLLMRGQHALGIAMWLAKSSRPASGGEHLISHSWDMKALKAGVLPSFHGHQVAVGTLQMARLYEQLEKLRCWDGGTEPVDVAVRRIKDDQARHTAFLGSDPATVGKVHENEAELSAFRDKVKSAWPTLSEEIHHYLVPSDELEEAFRTVGCPTNAAGVGEDLDDAKATFLRARFLRSRFTVLDLFDALTPLTEVVDEVVR